MKRYGITLLLSFVSVIVSSGGVQPIIASKPCSAPSIEVFDAATNSTLILVGGLTAVAAPEKSS